MKKRSIKISKVKFKKLLFNYFNHGKTFQKEFEEEFSKAVKFNDLTKMDVSKAKSFTMLFDNDKEIKSIFK